ncbi:cell wall metabolism sensor histidine kinase WalK [Geobacter hydrogenophilus]|uniref:histidine kinase n=1 Tax=Geobacter hydrogenophilus TaxID=40983 RepID=A0A9W6LEZ6_9BACT|nr:ATP-binding protein [Geobacter hydrogenophilus]MBT0892623.1 cell wall metabolism sensor histidine kinase WalK [Geobacter hydrogenophilus]GLI40021.1 PAS domain-containing sensor histidine kinase [Geobacter hydrogenophilus]
MRFTIQWKLMASYLLLVLFIGGVFFAYLSHTLNRHLTAEIRQNLATEARLTRMIAHRDIGRMRDDAPAVAAAISRETRARVTIILAGGEVVGDSEIAPGQLKELENHLNRPEVQQALKSGSGESIRYSATIKTPMLYVAVPLRTAAGEEGVVRLSLPLTALEKAEGSIRTLLGASLAVSLLVALVLSYILSRVTSRSLRTITALAKQIGKGNYSRRIPVPTRDEVGELARVMNDMAARIEQQLERTSAEKKRLDTILRGMGEGLMVTDANGLITLVNPAFLDLFSLNENVEGRHIIEIARHPALNDAFKAIVASSDERIEKMTLGLGVEKHVLTHWVPLVDNGELQGVVAVFHDITDLTRLENIRRDFVANVSHELRTPVTVIKGYAEALIDGTMETDPERARKFVGIILSHSERLAALIGDLLTLSQLEAGNMNLEKATVRPDLVAKHALELLEPKAVRKGIAIDSSRIAGAPPVLADPGRLEQVLVNLIDNAIKYTPEGGSISFTVSGEEKMVRIGVKDTGVGIPPKDLPRIFERFYRVDTARSRDEGGTGLGLSIVKHIIQLHGGTVGVESEPGKGSEFWFTLKKA